MSPAARLRDAAERMRPLRAEGAAAVDRAAVALEERARLEAEVEEYAAMAQGRAPLPGHMTTLDAVRGWTAALDAVRALEGAL